MKLFRTIRNNWKKSVFFSVASIYGGGWAKRKWDDEELRRQFCNDANAFGQEAMYPYGRLRHVTVLLNPAARDNSSKNLFERNVLPLLHLAGLDVHIVKTEFEGQATGYMDVIEKGSTDAVILVGGSGLVMEAVTGLLRRPDSLDVVDAIPIGIIPTGKSNTFVKALMSPLLPRERTMNDVKFMGEAAMSIIRGKTRKIDVLKIEADMKDDKSEVDAATEGSSDGIAATSSDDGVNNDSSTASSAPRRKKKIFAIAGLEWGMFREVEEITDNYWYWGRRLKSRIAYLLSVATFKPWPRVVDARISYVEACEGCSKCFQSELAETRRRNQEVMDRRSLFQKIFTSGASATTTTSASAAASEEEEEEDRSGVDNPECGIPKAARLEGSQIVAAMDSVQNPLSSSSSSSAINLYSLPPPSSRWNFVSEGWRRWMERLSTMGFQPPSASQEPSNSFVRKVREFYLLPSERVGEAEEEEYLSVDDERFEVMPMHVALMKKRITCFAPQ